MKNLFFSLLIIFGSITAHAADDYKESEQYLALRDTMYHAFNDGDSARFFPALKNLEDYLLKQNDLHAYYTQRCNEIVFLMNRQRIFEAFKLARQLSRELQERKLDKEMYMAYNMLGHINRYCGNKEAAKENFRQVIEMMEKVGYYESMPPIFMNIVNVSINDDPKEALRMLNRAAEIAREYAPQRLFDIETRRGLSYFNSGDMEQFVEAYQEYRKGISEGKSSVHGRAMDIYYQAYIGNTDKAVDMCKRDLGKESHEAITMIYERAGRWKEAFESLKRQTEASDSINNVVLSTSMEGFRDELRLYDIERETAKARTITMAIIILLLSLLVVAMVYIQLSRRRHMKQLRRAYEHALESDKLKTAIIKNISHEIRTPLNIIAGFAQVLADPELSPDVDKRKEMARLIQKNTHLITRQIDEMIELSLNESTGKAKMEDSVAINDLLQKTLQENEQYASPSVEMKIESNVSDDFCLTTNRDMLRRALNVLVDNAIKYTNKGTITISATTEDNTLAIAVADTGVGIPKADAERIFERFVKLDTFKEGIGLGLTLCRTIMTRLDGTIILDTDYTGGARFVMKLKTEQ